MMGPTAGPRSEVAAGLNWLAGELPHYDSVAVQIAATPGTAAPEQRAQLEHLAAKLKAADLTTVQVSRDDTEKWAQFATVLKRLQEGDGLVLPNVR